MQKRNVCGKAWGPRRGILHGKTIGVRGLPIKVALLSQVSRRAFVRDEAGIRHFEYLVKWEGYPIPEATWFVA